jgi:hypothetical protein
MYTMHFCSVGLQADTADRSTCPPEGGRYTVQNWVDPENLQTEQPCRVSPENTVADFRRQVQLLD